MRDFSLMALLCLCVNLAGCAKKGAEYAPENHVGDRFEYSIEYSSPFGGVQKATTVTRTEGDEVVNGKTFHKLITTFSGIPGLDEVTAYQRWTPDGTYSIDSSDQTKTEYLDTPFPLEVGKSWTVKKQGATAQYNVAEMETVETPAGTFNNCLKVTFTGNKNEGTEYLAPKVGMVKLVLKSKGVPMTFLLTKYKN